MMKKKIVIFGTGVFYKKRINSLAEIENVYILAFLDNNQKKWGTFIDNIVICNPQDIKKLEYDYIILMSIYDYEMYNQLLLLGVEENKILYWQQFYSMFSKPQMTYYESDKQDYIQEKKKILFLIADIQYDGGTIAAIYAAICLRQKKYDVTISAPTGNIRLIKEVNNYGIRVVICGALPYIHEENWIKEYDIVIVNVLPMIQCACEISKYKPTLWWIHEASNIYERVLKQFSIYNNIESLENINICAVSEIAQKNFNNYFPNKVQRILCYGIPDMYIEQKTRTEPKKFSFAIIGTICELKAQHNFIKAAKKMKDFSLSEFWIIGDLNDSFYGKKIAKMIEGYSNIKVTGLLSREEIYKLYPEIDVVVCASREETMSIVMTEAMMFHKIGITTDRTGIAKYIVDGKNGFIVEADNVEMLSDRMQWIIDNKNRVKEIQDRARKTYEKFFTMERFGNNLESELLYTEKEWEKNEGIYLGNWKNCNRLLGVGRD